MAVKYEAMARGEKYTNASGEEKQRWIKCGVVLETKNGMSMKLESIPVNFDGWLSLFEPKPRDDQQRSRQADSDIPF